MSKRFYRQPKFGWGLPRLNPHPRSRAARQQRIPRAFSRRGTDAYSAARLERTASLVRGRGGVVGRILSRILRRMDRQQRPPDRPKQYTTNVD
jgi:hypothetical protein